MFGEEVAGFAVEIRVRLTKGGNLLIAADLEGGAHRRVVVTRQDALCMAECILALLDEDPAEIVPLD